MVGVAVFVGATTVLTTAGLYYHYSNLIDDKLKNGPFPNTSMIFSAPKPVAVGDDLTVANIVGIIFLPKVSHHG